MIDPEAVGGRLNADSHPEVVGPAELGRAAPEPLRAFGEQLVRMPWSLTHDLEDLIDKRVRHIGVK